MGVESNLEGLRIAGKNALPLIDDFMSAEDEGAVFMKALLALETGDFQTFNDLVDVAGQNNQYLLELQSALAWVNPQYLAELVKTLLTSDSSTDLILGLTTCAAHNRAPGKYLRRSLSHQDAAVRATAMHVGANLGSVDLVGDLSMINEWEDNKERYECGRALALLGDENKARLILRPLAVGDSSLNTDAVNLYMMFKDAGASRSLLKQLDAIEGRERDVVRGFGLLGDPIAMNWLIAKTEIPELSRLAGGSITMITGIDLAETDLETLDEPEGFEDGGINDDPEDDNVAMDEDEDLPWPNPELVAAWWKGAAKPASGQSYLDGRVKQPQELKEVLSNGMQRQRNAASVSLALLQPESRLLDTRLPAGKQKLWMN